MNIVRCFEATMELLGIATLLAFIFVAVRVAIDKIKTSLICEHHYRIQGRLECTDATILFLRCEKCGKEKQITIYDEITIKPREEG